MISLCVALYLYLGSLHNSSIRIGSDGVSLVCGDDLDKSTANDTTEEDTAKEDISEKQETEDTAATEKPDEKANDKTPSENEAEHLGKGITFSNVISILINASGYLVINCCFRFCWN